MSKSRNIAALLRQVGIDNPVRRAAPGDGPRAGRPTLVMFGTFAACSGLAGMVACSEGPLAPNASRAAATAAPAGFTRSATGSHRGPTAGLVASSAALGPTQFLGDTTIQTFLYDPATGVTLSAPSGFKVSVPAYGICDPIRSGYNSSLWNSACTPLSASMVFTMRVWTDRNGATQVAFIPDVRFSPSVTARLALPGASTQGNTAPVLQWCSTFMTNCVNEGANDPTMATSYDATRGVVSRRIKHFSGYNVGYGRGTGGGSISVTNY